MKPPIRFICEETWQVPTFTYVEQPRMPGGFSSPVQQTGWATCHRFGFYDADNRHLGHMTGATEEFCRLIENSVNAHANLRDAAARAAKNKNQRESANLLAHLEHRGIVDMLRPDFRAALEAAAEKRPDAVYGSRLGRAKAAACVLISASPNKEYAAVLFGQGPDEYTDWLYPRLDRDEVFRRIARRRGFVVGHDRRTKAVI